MNIDLSSVYYNAPVRTGGATPTWGTALGQSSPDFRFTKDGADRIIMGMMYKNYPLSSDVKCRLGKGGREYNGSDSQEETSKFRFVSAALFTKTSIILNGKKIVVNKPFGLLITQENESTWAGRRSIKYSDSLELGNYKNIDFYKKVRQKLGENACWFAYKLDVENQDELVFYVVKVSDDIKTYQNPNDRKANWLTFLPQEEQKQFQSTPSQIIYYGVPGCGKSNKIKDLLKDVPDERKERVVFHPEYTHADFVGQILPVVHDGVDYKFTPGPFTKMVAKAYKSLASENPEQFYLVIEEINRGNAAAIFGDVFQLLDRIKPGESDSSLGNGSVYTEGWSQYFVYNEDVNSKVLELAEAAELEMGSVTFTKDSGIRLPPNLSILATMNTSDQNVSTLDNAFQRRFDMELVRNEFEKDESGEFKTAAIKAQHDAVIEGANCTWGDFWENINKKIIQYNRGLASTEDKRLGPWFVCSVAGETGDGPRKIPAKTFTEKVLKYLWDDAFKFKRSQVFADGLSSLEQVVSAFEKADGEKLKAVFKEF